MLRKFIFHDVDEGQEVILPVTPQSYQIESGQGIQIVNLTQFGTMHWRDFPLFMHLRLSACFLRRHIHF